MFSYEKYFIFWNKRAGGCTSVNIDFFKFRNRILNFDIFDLYYNIHLLMIILKVCLVTYIDIVYMCIYLI